MSKVIENPDFIITDEYLRKDYNVRKLQAAKGMTLKCIAPPTMSFDDFGTFTAESDYPALSGVKENGYDVAQAEDDTGLTVLVNLDPNHQAIEYVGLFGIVDDKVSRAAMAKLDS